MDAPLSAKELKNRKSASRGFLIDKWKKCIGNNAESAMIQKVDIKFKLPEKTLKRARKFSSNFKLRTLELSSSEQLNR